MHRQAIPPVTPALSSHRRRPVSRPILHCVPAFCHQRQSGIGVDAQPATNSRLDQLYLSDRQHANPSNEPWDRNRYKTLSIERARLEKSNRHRNFETGAAPFGGMRNQRHDRTIRAFDRDAEDQARPDLRRQSQIDQPNLSAWRRSQICASRRSSSRNTASAARRNCSSVGAV